jgi:hypothetical protein
VCSRALTTTQQELSLTLDLDAIVSRYGSLERWPGTSFLLTPSVRVALRRAGAVSPLGTATCFGGRSLLSLVPVTHDGLPPIDELRAHPANRKGFAWWTFAPAADRRVSFACVGSRETPTRRYEEPLPRGYVALPGQHSAPLPRDFVALTGPNAAPSHAVLDPLGATWVLRASPDPIPRAAACCVMPGSIRPMECDPSHVAGDRISDGAPDCDGLYPFRLGRGSSTTTLPARPAQRGSRR